MKFMFMHKWTKHGLDGILLPYSDLRDKKWPGWSSTPFTVTSCNNQEKISKSQCSNSGVG